eukprot:3427953-Rhodomonas_salina.2
MLWRMRYWSDTVLPDNVTRRYTGRDLGDACRDGVGETGRDLGYTGRDVGETGRDLGDTGRGLGDKGCDVGDKGRDGER